MIREYKFPLLEKVIFGAGALAQVPKEINRLGKERVFILTGQSLTTKTDLVRKLEALLENRWVGTYSGCQQHVPSHTVTEAAARAREAQADLIISFGGGSPIDTSKIVALELLGNRPQDAIPQIAISTTLSAGEFTPFAGITDEKTRVKGVRADPRIMPKIVVLDPEVTLATPTQLWVSTGMKALDHAIEALWSLNPQPVPDTLAMEAIRKLHKNLPLTVKEPKNLEARGECQVAAWMSIFGVANVGMRLSHIFGHQIGARWDVPHGITSCITIPHCMRFLAPQTLDRQMLIAQAFGIKTEGREPEEVAVEAASTVESFIDSFGLPRRLRDVGAKEEELPAVAHAVVEESAVWHRQQGAEEALLGLLRKMW
ncbi:MAG: iron-containing alcohol dehydrogenase [Candidatus Tectomicrobia bacterium]|uniref:Iron-containing alcohol dehydrogenase n=1 Tax=Tectimicrobiota bacterium TaxID=2528274 RepID=A0A933GL92_UNCTE|nr:iron-containing alcohol dehydrogenase [Candidatus Tectomicrobia bacterium]